MKCLVWNSWKFTTLTDTWKKCENTTDEMLWLNQHTSLTKSVYYKNNSFPQKLIFGIHALFSPPLFYFNNISEYFLFKMSQGQCIIDPSDDDDTYMGKLFSQKSTLETIFSNDNIEVNKLWLVFYISYSTYKMLHILIYLFY